MKMKRKWGILRHNIGKRDAVWDGWYLNKRDAEQVAELFKVQYPNQKVFLINRVM